MKTTLRIPKDLESELQDGVWPEERDIRWTGE